MEHALAAAQFQKQQQASIGSVGNVTYLPSFNEDLPLAVYLHSPVTDGHCDDAQAG